MSPGYSSSHDSTVPGAILPLEVPVVLGYEFRDQSLLERAVTHRSFSNEQKANSVPDSECLEFLGDAVLGLVISDLLFRAHPSLDEGALSRRRAFLVSASNLLQYAQQLNLGALLRLGLGEEKTGGRGKPALLVDAFEALIGAIYLDSGMEIVRSILERLFARQLASVSEEAVTDPKSMLQEALQEKGSEPVEYRLAEESGPDHQKEFRVQALVDGDLVAEGSGMSRRAAEQAAAEGAIHALGLRK